MKTFMKLSLILFSITFQVLISCSTDPIKEKDQNSLSTANVTYFDGICSSDCFTPNGYVRKIGEETVNAGINTKEVSYVAYNTQDDFVVETTYHVTEGNSKAEASITITIEGNVEKFENVQSGSTVTHTIPLPVDWSSCDLVNFSIRQVALGQPVVIEDHYGLVNLCPIGNIYEIGDEAKGGIIAYILQPGDSGYDENYQHGLVVSPTDLGSNIKWDTDSSYDLTNADDLGYGTGFNNTQTIVETLGTDQIAYAAQYCDDLVVNGYSDWFLPSKIELEKVLSNASAIGNINKTFGEPIFDSDYNENAYWSSSENDQFTAYVLGITISDQIFSYSTLRKNKNMRVRAVRYF